MRSDRSQSRVSRKLAITSHSDAPSTGNTKSETTGPTPTDPSVLMVVRQAWFKPFRTQSNFAREHARLVAWAASSGLITTQTGLGTFGPDWRVTPSGLQLIFEDFHRDRR